MMKTQWDLKEASVFATEEIDCYNNFCCEIR